MNSITYSKQYLSYIINNLQLIKTKDRIKKNDQHTNTGDIMFSTEHP